MQKITTKLERFFWMFVFINPFLDIFNGVFISTTENILNKTWEQIGLSFTPSLILRMSVLLLFGAYLIMIWDKRAFRTIIPIGAAWLFSVIGEFIFPMRRFALFTDIQYIARFGFNIAALFVLWNLFKRSGLSQNDLIKRLNSAVMFTLTSLSGSILLAYIFGAGYTAYADRFSLRGTRGFFYSGNDVTAILMLLLPIALCIFISLEFPKEKTRASRFRYLFNCFATASTITTLCLIGTKTAFMSVIVTVGAIFIFSYFQCRKKHDYTALKRIAAVLLTFIALLVMLSLVAATDVFRDIGDSFSATSKINEKEGAATALLSGRQHKLARAFKDYQAGGIYKWMFGVGRGSQLAIIEMDVFEVICYYGLFGAFFMLAPYVVLGFSFVAKFFKNITLFTFATLISLILCAGYLVLAGHILFSVTSGFYFSFMLLYGKLLVTPDYQNSKI